LIPALIRINALFEKPLLGVRTLWRAAMLRCAGPGGHVFQPIADHPHPEEGWRQANRTDIPLLLDRQFRGFPRSFGAVSPCPAGHLTFRLPSKIIQIIVQENSSRLHILLQP